VTAAPSGRRLDVALLALYFGAGLPLQLWSAVAGPPPLMNYAPAAVNAVVYALLGPCIAALLWRRATRARSSVYMFCTFDVLRSMRLAHWLPALLDLLIVAYLQTPAMRRVYPSLWGRMSTGWPIRIGTRP